MLPVDEPAVRAVAAGPPQCARELRLLCMYGVTGAQPLKTGELSRAIAVIKARHCLGSNPAAHLDVCSYQAVILLSQLPAARGHVAAAHELRCAAALVIDANSARHGRHPRGTLAATCWWYTTASLRAVAFQPVRAEPQRPSLWD